jgi:hypothetical protein
MKKIATAQQQLHLVTSEEAAAVSQSLSQNEENAFIANGIRRYQQLQREFDEELFGSRDLDKITALLPEINLLRERLASYGIHVRP